MQQQLHWWDFKCPPPTHSLGRGHPQLRSASHSLWPSHGSREGLPAMGCGAALTLWASALCLCCRLEDPLSSVHLVSYPEEAAEGGAEWTSLRSGSWAPSGMCHDPPLLQALLFISGKQGEQPLSMSFFGSVILKLQLHLPFLGLVTAQRAGPHRHRLRSTRSGMGLENVRSNKFPSDADNCCSGTRL